MIEPRDTIPFPLGRGPVDRGDGVTVATDFCDGRYEATYLVDGQDAAVAYVDELGNPRVDFREQANLGLADFKRWLVVSVLAWAHAQELSVLWRTGGGDHAG